ncbi:MAG: beta-lactamase family protein, partial [Acidobacteriia bacterium]|nr:beta-lactamase family protein [Terriglobia bacterium]
MCKHVAGALFWIGGAAFCAAGFSAEREQQAHAYIVRQMADRGIPGMAVAVVRNGEPVMRKAYGLSSVALNVPVTNDTVFQLFSVTKLWAGVAAMKLAEKGKLTTETPATDLVSGLPDSWAGIRVRHLLSHTSGIAEWRSNPRAAEISEEDKADLSARRAVNLSAQMPRLFVPGERFSYHRTAYSLFTLIVETVAGMRYAEFLEREVFAPLEMHSTRFGDSMAVIPQRPPTNY